MAKREFAYCWTWELRSTCEALWPLVSNTERFNRDCGFPSVARIPSGPGRNSPEPATRRLQARRLGWLIEWDEYPFDWLAPLRFGVERVFRSGPFSLIRARCDLRPRSDGGCTLVYQTWFTPASWLGRLALAFGAADIQFRRPFDRVFRHYDSLALKQRRDSDLASPPQLSPGSAVRIERILQKLSPCVAPGAPLLQLLEHVRCADDLAVTRMRPYRLAQLWKAERRATLELFLHATRQGLLDLSWDILCPLCRGPKAGAATLSDLNKSVHCDSCMVDFTADFDRSVEITFSPNPAVRRAGRPEYCVGGPQLTPHILAQTTLEPGAVERLALPLAHSRYRVRCQGVPARAQPFRSEAGAPRLQTIDLTSAPSPEFALSLDGELELRNPGSEKCLAMVEHLSWSEDCTSAAEVVALQIFRDLFSREVLRPGEEISVGTLTLVFTDLKGSTQLYRNLGDAPAFGRVLDHFSIMKSAIGEEGGAVVKTMGDAVMAVFKHPVPALRALLRAQEVLAKAQVGFPEKERLALKASLHQGPCLAINQNEQLDYFGTTVNTAARLCSQCGGDELVLSENFADDPEVKAFLTTLDTRSYRCLHEELRLRGLEKDLIPIRRLRRC